MEIKVEKEQTNKTDLLVEVFACIIKYVRKWKSWMLWNGTVNKTGEPWAAHTQNSKRKTPDNLPSLAPCLQAVVQHFSLLRLICVRPLNAAYDSSSNLPPPQTQRADSRSLFLPQISYHPYINLSFTQHITVGGRCTRTQPVVTHKYVTCNTLIQGFFKNYKIIKYQENGES